jgi:hypothetical protein
MGLNLYPVKHLTPCEPALADEELKQFGQGLVPGSKLMLETHIGTLGFFFGWSNEGGFLSADLLQDILENMQIDLYQIYVSRQQVIKLTKRLRKRLRRHNSHSKQDGKLHELLCFLDNCVKNRLGLYNFW